LSLATSLRSVYEVHVWQGLKHEGSQSSSAAITHLAKELYRLFLRRKMVEIMNSLLKLTILEDERFRPMPPQEKSNDDDDEVDNR
jgi:hypothetical protein